LEKITSEIKRSGKTINDLLELARNQPLKRHPVQARHLAVNAVSVANLPRGIDVTLEVPEGVVVDADFDQLTRVLTNLLINAGQAMNGNGHIWIAAHREGASTTFRVRDDGPGVPADLWERIFEALFTTMAKGSGLGLALCRRIAEAHGGTVSVAPSERGATFHLSIPDTGNEVSRSHLAGSELGR
jgi:signal transduction histidine kinase